MHFAANSAHILLHPLRQSALSEIDTRFFVLTHYIKPAAKRAFKKKLLE